MFQFQEGIQEPQRQTDILSANIQHSKEMSEWVQ